MTTCQARKIRSGIHTANRCWDLTKFGGSENEYFEDAVYNTRIAMNGLKRYAFDERLKKLKATGKVVQR